MPQARSGGGSGSGSSRRRSSSSSASGGRTTSARSGGGRSAGGSRSSASGSRSASGRSRSASSSAKASSSGRSSSGASTRSRSSGAANDARLEALAQRARKLNERIIEAGREAGETTLTAYERALKSIASSLERGPGSSDIEWLSNLATSQAKFIRDVTNAWTSAARGMLK